MITNVPLLGYIENTASDDSNVDLSLAQHIDNLHLDFNGSEIEEIDGSAEPNAQLRVSFGSSTASSLGYIENSTIEDESIDGLDADKSGVSDVTNKGDKGDSFNKSSIAESPISIRSISTEIGSSSISSIVSFKDDSFEYGDDAGEIYSDEEYYSNLSLSSLGDGNGLTEEDFSNISLFLDEQQAAIPFDAIPSSDNEVVMTSLGLKLLPSHLSPTLKFLDLSHNELKAITSEISHLTLLSQLLLWDNSIDTLDPAIGHLVNLRVMDLNHNLLSYMPVEINMLKNLRQLLLVNNKFTEFPAIYELHSLNSLHLEMNSIEVVPPQIGQLTSLTELILTNNLLTDVSEELFHLPNLHELRLSHNHLTSIPEDLHMPNLEILTLDHNDLPTLVPGIFQLSSLMNFDASHNKLHNLPNMDGLPNLVSLNLNNNHISEIPASIGRLASLQYLLIYNNNLKELPPELVGCSELVDLGLGGNELPSIYNLGTSAVLSHLREVEHKDAASPPILHDWEINFHELQFFSKLGEGAFGQVFQGKWRGHDVAIKKLFSEALDEQTVREFRREVGMLSRLKPHKHLVRYFGACTQPPHLYIINEFIARGSLHDLLHQSFMEISPAMKLKFAQGTALGCHFLINNDPPLYHCDLKAKNLLITLDWDIKLSDFGQSTFDNASNNNADWTYVSFAAPEILKKAPHSEKSEVFSFGVILWELLTRKIPFQNQEPAAIKLFIQNGGRLEVPENCPRVYKQLLIDCWHEDPLQRPTFMEIYLRLKNIQMQNSS